MNEQLDLRARRHRRRRLEPRPYQARALAAIVTSEARRVLVVSPTGSGKMVIAALLILEIVHSGGHVLFVAHRRELILQAVAHLIQLGIPAAQVSVLMGDDRRIEPSAQVQVASIDTLRARGARPRASFVFVDEAHRVLAPTYERLGRMYPKAMHIGFTATAARHDGKPLRNAYDVMIDVAKPSELIADGHLAEPRVWTVPMDLLPDMRGSRVSQGDYSHADLEARTNRSALVGGIVEHWKRHAAGRRTVVFAATVAHSKRIVAEFLSAGVSAVHLDGTTPQAERDRLVGHGGMLDRGAVDVVVNCNVVAEGWDLPSCKCIVLARPTRSLTVYLQQAGRVARPHAGVTPVILDHCGNVMRFGHPCMDRVWSLDGVPTVDATAPPCKVCPVCYEVRPAGAASCPCGHEWPVRRDPPSVAGTLVEVRRVRSDAQRQADEERVRTFAAARGLSTGWTTRVVEAMASAHGETA